MNNNIGPGALYMEQKKIAAPKGPGIDSDLTALGYWPILSLTFDL